MAANEEFRVSRLFNVEGWVAVITGGGTGIGLMAAQALANNGARVYIAGRRPEVLESAVKTHGANLAHPKGQLIAIQTDIRDKESIQKFADEIAAKEKKVDILINNAGISRGSSEVEKGHEEHGHKKLKDELWTEKIEEWDDTFKTNVTGHFFTTVAFLPLLTAANTESHTPGVINITSISGITRTTQHHYKYNVSKAAALQLSHLLAQELRRPGVKVRVNNIAPGVFPSEMTTKEESDETNKSYIPVDEEYGEKKGIPAGRPGRDADMAQAILALACNEYLYGSTLTVDGGYLLEHP